MSFVALVIFGAITNALLAQDAVPQFDLWLAAALRETATPRADAFWTAVSRLGTVPIMLLPALAMGLMLVERYGWLPLWGGAAAMIGGRVLDAAVKQFFVHPHGAATSFSAMEMGTPSGQALGAVVGYGIVAYYLVLLVPGRRLTMLAATATTLLVLAICFGRLYLGARYFSDVVSGLAAGGVWLSACITGLEVARRRAERDRRGGIGRRQADFSANQ
jgi:membrane-associated phospholipid phosphatase